MAAVFKMAANVALFEIVYLFLFIYFNLYLFNPLCIKKATNELLDNLNEYILNNILIN